MIPQEVADIAATLRYRYQDFFGSDREKELDYSIKVAWDIYNYFQKMNNDS